MSIEVKNLTYKYNANTPLEVIALNNINFQINDGEFVGIIGHTGSGKSTLMQILNALITPTEGHIYINNLDINESKETRNKLRKDIGLVFQYPEHQLFEMTVYDDIAFGPKNINMSKEDIEKSIANAIELVGLDKSYYDKSPFDLSGGQKRKVAIAGVLAMNPKILILDEPTAGLDPKSRNEILNNIKIIKEKMNLTVILVSHSMEDISKLTNKLIVLNDGKILFNSTPAEIFSNQEKLEEVGLSIPQSSKLINELKKIGIFIPEDLFELDSITNALYDRLKGGVSHD